MEADSRSDEVEIDLGSQGEYEFELERLCDVPVDGFALPIGLDRSGRFIARRDCGARVVAPGLAAPIVAAPPHGQVPDG